MEVHFVRHGSTQWNREHRHQGRLPGIGLDEEGRVQVEALALWLSRRPYTVVVSGPLQRALETADILRATGALDAPVVHDGHFSEWAIPPWDRLTFSEIAVRFPDEYRAFLDCPDLFSIATGETLVEVSERAVEGVRLLETTYGDAACVLIVTHASIIAAAVVGLLGAPLALFRRFPVANASLTVIRTGTEPALQLFNWHPDWP